MTSFTLYKSSPDGLTRSEPIQDFPRMSAIEAFLIDRAHNQNAEMFCFERDIEHAGSADAAIGANGHIDLYTVELKS